MAHSQGTSYRPQVEQLEDRLVLASVLPGFGDAPVTFGLTRPTSMEFAPDGRIFVAEQGGTLRIVKNGSLLAAPFLTLNVNSTGERGLLGVAIDPNFTVNHFIYVYYTTASASIHNRVSRFTANGDVVVPGSEFVLLDLEILTSATNHNGGALHFGPEPDPKLYVAVGENAVPSNSQTLNNRLGKILRINKDGSIPSDNPFFNQAVGVNRAIWALGLRNPYTFAFQPGTGRMFINDVGQSAFEEINDGIAGGNYGWPFYEGLENPPDPRFLDPFFTYARTAPQCAITGGTFYNPVVTTFPSGFVDKYFFSDLCAGWIRWMDPVQRTVAEFATGINNPVDLDVGPDGSLYYLAYAGTGIGQGHIGRIRYTANDTIIPGAHSLGVFDPATAVWYQRHRNSPGAPDTPPFAYGAPGWISVVGDWNGDGTDTIGVFDPTTAAWYLRNSNSPGAPDIAPFAYGAPGWIPIVGDWNGNGTDTIGVFDPATATWYLRNSNSPGAPDFTPFPYGAPGWIPVVGDWNGNNSDTIGVFAPFGQFGQVPATWYLRNSNSLGPPDLAPFQFGAPGWIPIVGDWNGNNTDTVGVFDPFGQFGKAPSSWYLRNSNSSGAPDIGPFPYGGLGWRPVPGRWIPAAGSRVAGEPGVGAPAITSLEVSTLAAALGMPSNTIFEVRNLGVDLLGLAYPAERRIVLDDDAAGHGWFLDPTPVEDEEFDSASLAGLEARPDGPAAGRVELATVLRHEWGHLEGLDDLDAGADARMAGTLPPGVRRK